MGCGLGVGLELTTGGAGLLNWVLKGDADTVLAGKFEVVFGGAVFTIGISTTGSSARFFIFKK